MKVDIPAIMVFFFFVTLITGCTAPGQTTPAATPPATPQKIDDQTFDNAVDLCREHAGDPAYCKNPYEPGVEISYEELQCLQGTGELNTCLQIADKNNHSRESMKRSWCRTNSC
jgi:hypothetical protein